MTDGAGLPTLLGVVGAGQMGAGIAQVFATSGLSVCLVDPKENNLVRAVQAIRVSLDRLASKGKLQGDPTDIMSRIQTSTKMQARMGRHRRHPVPHPRPGRSGLENYC